jgi:phage anti-repressor protein
MFFQKINPAPGSSSALINPGGYIMTESKILPFELIEIGNKEQEWLDAKKLHEYLKIKPEYTNWIKRHIMERGFQENTDYLIQPHLIPRMPMHDKYFLSPAATLELAIIEQSPKVKSIRHQVNALMIGLMIETTPKRMQKQHADELKRIDTAWNNDFGDKSFEITRLKKVRQLTALCHELLLATEKEKNSRRIQAILRVCESISGKPAEVYKEYMLSGASERFNKGYGRFLPMNEPDLDVVPRDPKKYTAYIITGYLTRAYNYY